MSAIKDFPNSKKLTLRHTVCSHEINLDQKLSIPVLMGILQEMAYRHAEERGWGWSSLSPKNHFWVLMRMQISIAKYPRWTDDIAFETWATGCNGLFANRSWQVMDQSEQSIIKCNANWVVIDGETRKVQRLNPEDFKPWLLDDILLPGQPAKIKELESKILIGEHRIQLSEIDLMQHVNNANYVKWVLDSIDLEFFKIFEVQKIDINFIKEAKFPNTVLVFEEKHSALSSTFSLVSKNDKTEHVRVHIEWRKK